MNGETMDAEPFARGRYAVYEQPDKSVVIARSDGLCETCQSCGCGEQVDPITIPAMVAQQARRFAEGKLRLPSMPRMSRAGGRVGK